LLDVKRGVNAEGVEVNADASPTKERARVALMSFMFLDDDISKLFLLLNEVSESNYVAGLMKQLSDVWFLLRKRKKGNWTLNECDCTRKC
jgi:hypothetical protein